jgi:hypothetical protein
VRRFDLDRVKQEITWVGEHGCWVLWIADANFGMYERDVEIARHIVATKKAHGFPREVAVNYMKNTTRRLAEIIRIFVEGGIVGQGILSLQTTDADTLSVIARSNIRTEKYQELASVFRGAGLPLSTDLMIGLPGSTPASFARDLQHGFDVDVTVKAYPTAVLPNSPMADPAYLARYQIEVDEHDLIASCSSFTRDELAEMKWLYQVFTLADGYGVLRYVARYLQWEHDISVVVLLQTLIRAVREDPATVPRLAWVLRYLSSYRFVPGGWRGVYEEVAEVCMTHFGIVRDSAFEAVLTFNEAVMPEASQVYPMTVSLPHDVEAWFVHRRGGGLRPLRSFAPASSDIDDPDGLATLDISTVRYDTHQYFWELASPLRRATSRLMAPTS